MKMGNSGTVMSMMSVMELSFQIVHMLMSQQPHFHTQLVALVLRGVQTSTFNVPRMIVQATALAQQ